MKKIPTFIIEEHHEAFFVWNYCIHKGFIKPDHNCLLHVDSHSDFSIPTLKTSIDSLQGNLQKIRDFTYKELSISDFIIPALYMGILNKVIWIDQTINMKNKDAFPPDRLLKGGHASRIKNKKNVEAFVQSKGTNGKTLFVKKLTPKIKALQYSGRKEFSCHYLSIPSKLKIQIPCILDIDLDYFSCIENTEKTTELNIEITQESYTLLQNPYHPINLLMQNPTLKKVGKRYFIFFSQVDEKYVSDKKVDEEEIMMRMNVFISFLKENTIQPQIIDICRSRYSGFTPEDQWTFIEEHLIEALKKLYHCEILTLNEISAGFDQV